MKSNKSVTANFIRQRSAVNGYSGLQGWWKFNEGSGTSVLDYSGNGFNGTLNASAGWGIDGHEGGALRLSNAHASYANLGTSNFNMNTTNALTISCWIYLNDTSGSWYKNVVQKGEYVYPFRLRLSGRKIDSFVRTNNDSGGLQLLSNKTITIGSWVHIALTYANDGTGTIYIDGTADAIGFCSGILNISQEATIIGSVVTEGNNTTFNGLLDDLRIYNRVLSASEIILLYQGMPPEFDTEPPK
jgi:hypothetical protein